MQKMDRRNHFPHPELEAHIDKYTAEWGKSVVPQSVDDIVAQIKAGGYTVERGGAFSRGKLVGVPANGRRWVAYEEWYHARVANEGFLKEEIAAIKTQVPERVFPPGYKGQWGKEARPGAAAEEIAIKEHILKNHAADLSAADKLYLENQIKVLREWGTYYGY